MSLHKTAWAVAALSLLAWPLAVRAADDPVELEPSDDTFLSCEHTGNAAGRGKKDELQIYGKDDHTLSRALLKFDLTRVPPGIRAAILQLTGYNAHWNEAAESYLRCHPLKRPWTEDAASWDESTGGGKWLHPGGDFDPLPLSGFRFSGPLGGEKKRPIFLDLTAAARAWQGQPAQNFGCAVMMEQGCLAELRFRSKEYAKAEDRPKLLLYYQKDPQKSLALIAAKEVPPYEPYDPAAPKVTVAPRPAALKVGDEFQAKYAASGGKGPCAFAFAGPAIPGLSLQPDGTLKGKPSRAGTYLLGVQAADGAGKRGSLWLRVTVSDPAAQAAAKPPEEKKAGDGPPKPPTPPGEKAAEKKPAQADEE